MSNCGLHVRRSDAPLILAFPHGGTVLPTALIERFRSPWSARRDADWHIADLYAGLVDATTLSTDLSRSVIDCNRDPSGASLYPGQATTELCPTTDFDGNRLYRDTPPDEAEIAERRAVYFDRYHTALSAEIMRLRAIHDRVVVYDCHSIRSVVPRLFDGPLPLFNIGSNGGTTCASALVDAVATACAASGRSHVIDGRFRGGWTTRNYGQPERGIHAIQMEIAMRGYLEEPADPAPDNWPPPYDPARAEPLRIDLARILNAVLDFAKGSA